MNISAEISSMNLTFCKQSLPCVNHLPTEVCIIELREINCPRTRTAGHGLFRSRREKRYVSVFSSLQPPSLMAENLVTG